MQGYSKIRWTDSDVKELKTVINLFNKKTNSLRKMGLSYIPKKVNYREYKKMIVTRRDLKREIKTLTRFLVKGAEQKVYVESAEGKVPITRWQRTEINRRRGIINRRRKMMSEKLSDISFTYQGKDMGYKVKDIGIDNEIMNSYKPFVTFSKDVSNVDVNRKWNVVLKQSQSDYIAYRNGILRDNIINTINEHFDKKDVKEVISNIENMDDEELVRRYYRNGANFEPFYTDPKDEKYQYFLNDLKSNWL